MGNIFNNIDAKNKYKLLKSFRADIYSFTIKTGWYSNKTINRGMSGAWAFSDMLFIW